MENSTPIKAIIFDIEGVLTKENGEEQRKVFAEQMVIDEKKFSESAKKYLDFVHKGNIDGLQFFQMICNDLDIPKEKAPEMVKKWLDIRESTLEINPDVWTTIEKLKEKGHLIAALTNITKLNHEARTKKGIYKLFKFNVLSFEANSKKPEKEIYNILLQDLNMHNIKAEETLFIDDNPEYLVPAANMKMNIILFQDNNQLIKELEKLGITI